MRSPILVLRTRLHKSSPIDISGTPIFPLPSLLLLFTKCLQNAHLLLAASSGAEDCQTVLASRKSRSSSDSNLSMRIPFNLRPLHEYIAKILSSIPSPTHLIFNFPSSTPLPTPFPAFFLLTTSDSPPTKPSA